MMLPLSRPPRWLRERLFARSGGHCERTECRAPLTLETLHVAHLYARAHGGPLIEENVAAWCAPCNLRNGPRDVADHRVLAREWQLEALDVIIDKLLNGAATLSAAPGAGKTLFAGLVFERLYELDAVDRMVVLVPRRTLVKQWAASLAKDRYLELRPDAAYERPHSHQIGVVATYQSLLNREQRQNHREQIAQTRTLLVLDEVHHVGEPAGPGQQIPAWAQYVKDLAGTVEPPDLHVTAVLNLSGTLWRSAEGERISTVRYTKEPDGRLFSCVDFDVPVELLIDRKELRPVDLFRLGARVEMNDYANLKVIDSHIADLDAKPARAAIAHLGNDPAWREAFVGAVLDRLKAAHQSLNGYPVKALIVATTQQQARWMRDTADALMLARGLRPMAKLAISDEVEASDVLEDFRKARTPGVLCTVDMAGEGYDCPDIAVIGFASNKLTPLYIRQVVARAQRVTAREREQQHPIPATVVIPDTVELVELMVSILQPMRHELEAPPAAPAPPPGSKPPVGPGQTGPLPFPAYTVEGIEVDANFRVNVTGVTDGEISGALVTAMEEQLTAVHLRSADAPRFIVAVRELVRARRQAQPFDPLSDFETDLESMGEEKAPSGATPIRNRPMTEEVQAKQLGAQLQHAAGWSTRYMSIPVEQFVADVNRAGKIPKGGRRQASIAQLEAAWQYAEQRIFTYCDEHQLVRPTTARWRFGNKEKVKR
jgi:superfamily II DNA or RNA helicase